LDTILFFSDKGKVYSERAYQIPDADRTARGIPIVNVLSLDAKETITAAVAVPKFDEAEYCTMATRLGRVKRVVLSEFSSVRPSGLAAISLDKDDELGWVRLTHGDNEIILVTEHGYAVRYPEEQIRAMGRTAAGVIGIRMRKGDYVTSMDVVETGGDLLVVTRKGYGKRTPLTEYSSKNRGGSGMQTINLSGLSKVGPITSARVVQTGDDLTIISANGVVMRTNVEHIPQTGRSTRGSLLMGIQEGDSVASVARIAAADLIKAGVSTDQ
jgi:DNA gyrase subunit A